MICRYYLKNSSTQIYFNSTHNKIFERQFLINCALLPLPPQHIYVSRKQKRSNQQVSWWFRKVMSIHYYIGRKGEQGSYLLFSKETLLPVWLITAIPKWKWNLSTFSKHMLPDKYYSIQSTFIIDVLYGYPAVLPSGEVGIIYENVHVWGFSTESHKNIHAEQRGYLKVYSILAANT